LKAIHITPWWRGGIEHVSGDQEAQCLISNIQKYFAPCEHSATLHHVLIASPNRKLLLRLKSIVE